MAIKIQNTTVIDDSRNLVNPGEQSLNNLLPAQGAASGKFLSSNGTSVLWATLNITSANFPYDQRSQMRTLSPNDGDMGVVEGLGLFKFSAGSTEPDDDETCFATSTGRWLLEAMSFDLMASYTMQDEAVQEEDDEDQLLAWKSRRINFGNKTQTIGVITPALETTITIPVLGAKVGDVAIVNTSSETRLLLSPTVSASDTVTVVGRNPYSTNVIPGSVTFSAVTIGN